MVPFETMWNGARGGTAHVDDLFEPGRRAYATVKFVF